MGHIGLVDKCGYVLVHGKRKHFNLYSPETSFKRVSDFPCPAVSVFSVFPQKTVYMSSLTMEVAENVPSKSFRVFKTVVLMYVVQILNMTFTLLPLLTLLPSSFRAFKHVCSFNILQSAISECRPLIICSLNSSTFHLGIRSLLKQLCTCKC